MFVTRVLARVLASLTLAVTLALGNAPVAGAADAVVRIDEPVITDLGTWGFAPDTLRVAVGDTVTWANVGAVTHTVTARATFDSGSIAPAGRFTLTPAAPGTFRYICALHPFMQATLIVEASSATQPAAPPRTGGCRFVLGFAALRAAVGARVVGDCLEDEGHDSTTGDALQHTTGGLLVWRQADNVTAFTDGFRTWLNGPRGLQQRLNTERLEWER